MKNILISCVFLILAGCATGWDVKLNNSDNDAIKNGQNNSAVIVTSQTEAISKISTNAADPTVSALLKVFMAQAIASIETPMFAVKKSRTNPENVQVVMETLGNGIPFITMGKVATTAIENDRGITNQYSEGGDISMKDSLNRVENHSIANDGSSAATSNNDNSSVEGGE